MRLKRCKMCGCIIYDEFNGDICDVCLDDKNFSIESSDSTTEEEESSESE